MVYLDGYLVLIYLLLVVANEIYRVLCNFNFSFSFIFVMDVYCCCSNSQLGKIWLYWRKSWMGMLYNCFRNANFGNNNGMVFGALNIKLYLHLCCLFVHSWDVSLLIGVLFSIRSLTIGENYAISLYFLHHWLESISFTLSNILPIPSYAFPCSSTLYLICSVLAA